MDTPSGMAPRRPEAQDIDVSAYKPRVESGVWYISETDVEWISIGCYILGTGGGGSPYAHMIRLRQMIRDGAVVRVVSPTDLDDNARVGCGGGVGSPTVGIEKLQGDAMVQAQEELFKVCRKPSNAAIHALFAHSFGMRGLPAFQITGRRFISVDTDTGGYRFVASELHI